MLLRLLSSAEVEGVAGEGERRQVLRAIGEEAEPAMGGRRVQLEMVKCKSPTVSDKNRL